MRFHLDEEAIPALWDGVLREIENAAAPEVLSHSRLEVARTLFYGVLANFGQDILCAVPEVAAGASKVGLTIRLRPGFEHKFAREALRLLDVLVRHDADSELGAVH